MGHKKLVRFAEIAGFKNVLQYSEGMSGRWGQHFGNAHPVVLELACGKGEYTTGLAAIYPGKNFVGVDIKGNRIWVGAKKALEQGLQNVAFLRSQIERVAEFFGPQEVEEIWITFPDPQLRLSKAKKRLTHPRFLRLYHQILKPGGRIHLKTDSPDLYHFTKEVLKGYHCNIVEDIADIHERKALSPELAITTHYEGLDIAQSHRVHYLSFTLPGQLPGPDQDIALKELFKHETG